MKAIGATVILLYTEKLRNGILAYDLKTFLQVFKDGSEHLVKDSFIYKEMIYRDIIDILIQKVRMLYFDREVSQNIADANTCLNRILLHNAPVGLGNRFVYDNRKEFVKICNEILMRYDSWDIRRDNAEILKLYDEVKEGVDSTFKEEQSRITINQIIKVMSGAKVVVLVLCIVAFVVQCITFKEDYVSLIFNVVAILLIGFDLLERELSKSKI